MIPMIYEPLFCRLIRCDGLRLNIDGSKYSIKELPEAADGPYLSYSEGI